VAQLNAYEKRQLENYAQSRKKEGQASSSALWSGIGAGVGGLAGLVLAGGNPAAGSAMAKLGSLGAAKLGSMLGAAGGLGLGHLFGGKSGYEEGKVEGKKNILAEKKLAKQQVAEQGNLQYMQDQAAKRSAEEESAAAKRASKGGGARLAGPDVVLSEAMSPGAGAAGGRTGYDGLKVRRGWTA